MRRLLYENGLSLVMVGLFVVFLAAQSVTGWHVYNEDQVEHGQGPSTYLAYLASSHFTEAVFELGERVSSDGRVRDLDRHPSPEGISRIESAHKSP